VAAAGSEGRGKALADTPMGQSDSAPNESSGALAWGDVVVDTAATAVGVGFTSSLLNASHGSE